VSFASAKRDYRVPDKTLAVAADDAEFEVTVSTLPFYTPEPLAAKGRRLYEQALQLYAKEDDVEAQSRAVDLLRESLELDPIFEDGYEALGVIQSKRGHLDEAIELMKQLAELNPDSIMAHTNLSVFYLEKGWKDEAEEEKATSVSIRMRLAVKEANAEKPDDSQRQQEVEETKQRMNMFKEVLAIDGEDLLANYGVGSCHVALAEFEQAIPFLKKAIEVKPTYTQAYLSLGKAYEGKDDLAAAMKTYELGIEVAAKRGDMTPLTEMQHHLTRLKVHSENHDGAGKRR
jgi:tetratricopeptide (TPR) repeat protein